MNSYTTIEEARVAYEAHPRKDSIRAILEIEPGMAGVERYILYLGTLSTMRQALINKPMAEIKAVVGIVVDLAAERRAAAEAQLAANVPGLKELEAALNDEERYDREFRQMMKNENNDGVRPPHHIAVSAAEVAEKYPVAAAYYKAECWEEASHYVQSGIGKAAKARIAKGEDYLLVIQEMDAAWDSYTQEHVDD